MADRVGWERKSHPNLKRGLKKSTVARIFGEFSKGKKTNNETSDSLSSRTDSS